MHKITFFPLGNADSYRIDLENGKKILIDYGAQGDPTDADDKRVDLPKLLKDDLEDTGRDYFDVVAFTHLDKDHVEGSSSFFYLEHAEKYQDEDRIKIKELWVPAAAIVEEGLKGEARIIRQEARHRLKEKKGIRVFSRPNRLKEWLEENDLTVGECESLITNAGETIPSWSLGKEGIEFFVHSPFSKKGDKGEEIDRNENSLVLHSTFRIEDQDTKFLMGADTTHEIWKEIVEITKHNSNESRLEWDISKISHHCSYLSLGPEKGEEETEPIEEIEWLIEEQGEKGCVMISTSRRIPDDDENNDPPHRQAANYHKRIAEEKDGSFLVTMEHPNTEKPEPLVVEIEKKGPKPLKRKVGAAAAIISRPAPRAGD